MHSVDSVLFAFMGQAFLQWPQWLQVIVSTRMLITDIRLKSEYNAPKGHINRQNGRKVLIEMSITINRTAAFQTKSNPTVPRIRLLSNMSGIPASNVPVGHNHLQNAGKPTPPHNVITVGIPITRTINTTYFNLFYSV